MSLLAFTSVSTTMVQNPPWVEPAMKKSPVILSSRFLSGSSSLDEKEERSLSVSLSRLLREAIKARS
jgi:hypothetical protein